MRQRRSLLAATFVLGVLASACTGAGASAAGGAPTDGSTRVGSDAPDVASPPDWPWELAATRRHPADR